MKKIRKNWKTTIVGISTIFSGVASIVKGDLHTGCSLIVSGVGFLFAKDYDTKE
jgi:hypothetical protein